MIGEEFIAGQSGDPGGPSHPVENEPLPPAASDDGRTPSGKKRFPIGGNLFLVVLFAAGLAALYVLRLRAAPAQASAEQLRVQSQVDTALTKLSDFRLAARKPTDGGPDVADVFYFEARHRQIPLAQLRGNPFVFVAPSPKTHPLAPLKPGPQETSGEETEQLSEAMAAVKALTLQSVLTGEHGATVMISNNLLTEGQKIRGWTVEAIRSRQVVLSWQGHSYVLRMPE